MITEAGAGSLVKKRSEAIRLARLAPAVLESQKVLELRGDLATMLSVAEAQRLVLERAQPLPPARVEPDPHALGLILAEDVASDLDMPPYDKALMDGFAVRSVDLSSGQKELRIIEEVTAGQTPRLPVGQG